ncbi:hypothetical protein NL108_016769, partial [Boleophthalmus pectinirostris]
PVRAAAVLSWISFIVGLPALGAAIYTLQNLSKGERKVPPHVTLLLVSDVLSFLGRPSVNQSSSQTSPTTSSSSSSSSNISDLTGLIFHLGLVSNIYLMLFISQERHLLVAYPQCASSPSPCRISPFLVALKWALPFGVLTLAILRYAFWFAVALLAPFPLLLFLALDSWRALACSRSRRPGAERRRAAGGVAAIWVNYSAVYLPYVVSELLRALELGAALPYLDLVSHTLLYLGPLVDPLLYLFMTQGPRDVLKALPC